MDRLHRNQITYFILISLFCLIGLVSILATSKEALFLWFNGYQQESWNSFFLMITELGSGIAYFLFFGLIYLKDKKLLWKGFIAAFITTVVVMAAKFIFNDIRPVAYFDSLNITLNLIPNLEVSPTYSYPSGHTAASFTMTCFLQLMYRNNWIAVLLFFVSLLVGLSRVYLGFHFFEDIFIGAIVGSLSSSCVYFFYNRNKTSP